MLGLEKCNIIVCVSNRPPDHEELVVQNLYRPQGLYIPLKVLVFMGVFSHLDKCQRDNTSAHKQSRSFLHYFEDNFLWQMIEKSARTGAVLDHSTTSHQQGVCKHQRQPCCRDVS